MDILFVADAFLEQIPNGGGELYNDELCNLLISKGYKIIKVLSAQLTHKQIYQCPRMIIGNFLGLTEVTRQIIMQHVRYCIIEHDHKYDRMRNPALYFNFEIPKENIVYYDFYKNARAIICQTDLHAEIAKKNLKINNIINAGGSIWSDAALDLLSSLVEKPKNVKFVVLSSLVEHKNTFGAVQWCEFHDRDYDLLTVMPWSTFYNTLASYLGLVFLPKTPETCSRVVVEAKMLGLRVVTNNLVGARSQVWYELNGQDLIDYMRKKKYKICEMVESVFKK